MKAKELLPFLCGEHVEALRDLSATTHDEAIYTAVGGTRVTAPELQSVQTAVRQVAKEYSYPLVLQRGRYSEFDASCARMLLDAMRIVPAEAAKLGVWNFICCVMLPDVVRWRFFGGGATPPERFLGGVRNALSRLWWRAYVLEGADRSLRNAQYLDRLSEEELVQLFERPTLAGCRPLVRETAAAFLNMAEGGIGRRQELMRDAQKRLMRLAAFVSFDALDAGELRRLVQGALDASARAIGGA